MGEITTHQEKNLTDAVKKGFGFEGAHGGIIDSFRSSTNNQFMTEGQGVKHQEEW